MIILNTAVFALVLAFVLGTALGFFREFFAVSEDPMIGKIRDVLPGANCGACGFPGCDNYAAAIVAGNAGISSCTAGGPSVVEKIAAITGIAGGRVEQTVAVLACQGSSLHTPLKGTYTGIRTCRGAKLSGGTKLCSWGCLGFGDCVNVCKFGALSMTENRLPKVDYAKCTGCGLCSGECPMGLFKSVVKNQTGAMVLCSNKNPVKQMVAKTCKISCFKCGQCVRNCPEQCISLDTLVPVVDISKCTSCGTCAEKCPSKVFKIIERDVLKAVV
ncbi:MAG: RnfABCDGE type electron transport complex subunit B [Treponema sp.]|jgi:Na+-translocating ferredoxin:NAD+ oxidoreductase RNF subunit RnfB|nr:RnfABCDGE type electron transport complex subunit B [Treponema sp.]